MFQRRWLCLAILSLVFCLSSLASAADACSPATVAPTAVTVTIPEMGTPETPASGVADGWVLLYKDSSFKKLSREVRCQDNKIQFASSAGKKNFQNHPNCALTTCTRAMESAGGAKVTLSDDSGNINNFVWRGNFAVNGFTVLYSFTGGSDGGTPIANLIQDPAGNLYGTASSGGAAGYGDAFELTNSTTPQLNVLHSFNWQTDGGEIPYSPLWLDSSGNFYGTLSQSPQGAQGGVVFEISSSGKYSVVADFTQVGPMWDGVVPDSSGNLYVAVGGGGTSGIGSIYKVIPSTDTDLFLYGFSPYPGYYLILAGNLGHLAIDSSGNLYGTIFTDGANGMGAVFKLSSSAGTYNYTELHSFAGTDGSSPMAAPIVDSAGNLYGTTSNGGPNNGFGTVWKLSPSGTFTTLYTFPGSGGNGTDGHVPMGGVVLDAAGNIYGTTEYGGDGLPGVYESGDGVLYELSPTPKGGCPSGTNPGTGYCETILHVFDNATDGANPWAALYFSQIDGTLYGTTKNGGPNAASYAGGTIFAYPVASPQSQALTVTLAGTGLGTVSSTPAGINCPGTCTASFAPNTVVTLTETEGTNSAFGGWGGACSGTGPCQVTIYSAASVRATFTATSKLPTTTAVTSSLNPSTYGQKVTFTATVTGKKGTPTGTVTFYNNTTVLGTQALTNGSATLSTLALAAGTTPTSAVYSGDSNNADSTSPAISQVVNQATTTISLDSSPNPTIYGQNANFTATVTSQYTGNATGIVTFYYNGNVELGTATISGNEALFTLATLEAGNDLITATYSGDSNNLGSTSSAISQVVKSASTTASLAVDPEPNGIVGTPISIYVEVAGSNGGHVTGVVSVYDGTTFLAAPTLGSGGETMISPQLAAGTHKLKVVYGGDSNDTGSVSPVVPYVVWPAAAVTTLKVTSSPASPVYGGSVTFTVTATAKIPGSTIKTVPSGSLQFYYMGTNPPTLLNPDGLGLIDGKAKFTFPPQWWAGAPLPVGTDNIQASFYGGMYWGTATATIAVKVVGSATTTALTSTENPAKVGDNVIFNATVTAANGQTPSGTVTFKNGTQILQSGVPLSGGVAAYATSFPKAASYAISAIYVPGNGSFKTSTGKLTETVTAQ